MGQDNVLASLLFLVTNGITESSSSSSVTHTKEIKTFKPIFSSCRQRSGFANKRLITVPGMISFPHYGQSAVRYLWKKREFDKVDRNFG